MYKSLNLLLIFFYCCLNAQFLEDNGISLISNNSAGVEINLSIGEIAFEEYYYNNKRYNKIITNGIFLPADEGSPDFPAYSRIVAIPQYSNVSIEIIDYKKVFYNNILPLPAIAIPFDMELQTDEYNENFGIYNSSEIYPKKIIEISEPWKIRGVDVITFGIIPFEWHPITNNLTVYTDIKFRINFNSGNGIFGEERLRSRYWDEILKENIFNYNSLPNIDYSKRVEMKILSESNNAEFVIIIPDDTEFYAWADSIKRFRNERGIITEVFTLSDIGGNTASDIESWIDNAYYNWQIPPEAILLLSDYPASGESYGITSPSFSHPAGGYYVTDNRYASVGNDSLPDIVIGRITAQNSTQLNNIISKEFEYERNPPTSQYFYDHPVSAMGYHYDKWFQISAETIRGFWVNFLGKAAVRIYDICSNTTYPTPGNPWSIAANTSIVVNYFNAYGYIDLTIPSNIDWNGETQDLIDAINLGAFIVQHRDHGAITGWGNPSFRNWDLDNLTNSYGREWPFVFSTNCLTGKFNSESETFVEKFHRMPGKGAIGLNAASEISFAYMNDVYIWGIYDFMWSYFDRGYGDQQNITNTLPAFAMVSGKYYLAASSWPHLIYPTNARELTYELFHHFGDPYMRLYTEQPTVLNINHLGEVTAGQRYFTISANTHSFISLSVDGEIIGRGEATGVMQNIPIIKQNLGTNVKLIVTKQDCYTYEELLDVVLANGTLVGYAVTDSIVGGHNNGQINASLSYDLYIAVANWGTQVAYDVKGFLYSEDSNVIVDLDTIYYETILSNDTSRIPYPFHITVGNRVEDYHDIPLLLETWDSSDSLWVDTFYLTVNAPKVKTTGIYGPHLIFSGDSLSLGVKLENRGSGTAYSIDMKLRTDDLYVNIFDSTENINNLNPGDSILKRNAFFINVDNSIPDPHFADMYLCIEMEGEYFYIDTFTLGIGSVIFIEGFEYKDTADWTYTTDSGYPSWHVASRDAHVSSRSMFCGNTYGNYHHDIWNAKVISPEISVNDEVRLFFWHKYHIQHRYDGIQLLLSTDGGNNWITISTDQGYNSVKKDSTAGFYDGESIWSGNYLSTWQEQSYTFNYDGNIRLAWKFGSDWGTHFEGYYFDDIFIGTISNVNVEEKVEIPGEIVNKFSLERIYPNPTYGKVMIRYSIGVGSPVKLIIYDISGREISTLVNQFQSVGTYKVEWDGRDNIGNLVRSGSYFYILEAGNFIDINKLIIIR